MYVNDTGLSELNTPPIIYNDYTPCTVKAAVSESDQCRGSTKGRIDTHTVYIETDNEEDF